MIDKNGSATLVKVAKQDIRQQEEKVTDEVFETQKNIKRPQNTFQVYAYSDNHNQRFLTVGYDEDTDYYIPGFQSIWKRFLLGSILQHSLDNITGFNLNLNASTYLTNGTWLSSVTETTSSFSLPAYIEIGSQASDTGAADTLLNTYIGDFNWNRQGAGNLGNFNFTSKPKTINLVDNIETRGDIAGFPDFSNPETRDKITKQQLDRFLNDNSRVNYITIGVYNNLEVGTSNYDFIEDIRNSEIYSSTLNMIIYYSFEYYGTLANY